MPLKEPTLPGVDMDAPGHGQHVNKIGLTFAAPLTEDERAAREITDPQRLGDGRPLPAEPDLITELLDMPHALFAAARELRDLRNILAEANERQVWTNTADLSDQPQTGTYGASGCYATAMNAYTRSGAIQLRNILIGVSAAGVVQLYASKSDPLVFSPTANPRLLGTVRLTANNLTAWFPGEPILNPNDNLFLVYPSGAAAHFDFSADYRIMRGE